MLTTPDNLVSPDAGDGYALVTDLAAMQDSVQTALNTKVPTSVDYVWANAAARTAQTGMVTGQKGYQTDTAIPYRYDGSVWVNNTLPTAMEVGLRATSGAISNGAGINVTVTFTAGRFTSAPIVNVTPFTSSRLTGAVTVVSTTGCTVRLDNNSGATSGDSGFNWIAVQA